MTVIIDIGSRFDENSSELERLFWMNPYHMKPRSAKRIEHEAAYLVLLAVTLAAVSVSSFPMFLAILPVAILVVSREFWRYEQLRNRRRHTL